MADLVADLKRLRLYGMAACVAEGLEQGHPALASSTALLTQLVHAEATDRATRSIRYQMHVARFPIHRDLAGFDFEHAKVDRRQITSFATTAFNISQHFEPHRSLLFSTTWRPRTVTVVGSRGRPSRRAQRHNDFLTTSHVELGPVRPVLLPISTEPQMPASGATVGLRPEANINRRNPSVTPV